MEIKLIKHISPIATGAVLLCAGSSLYAQTTVDIDPYTLTVQANGALYVSVAGPSGQHYQEEGVANQYIWHVPNDAEEGQWNYRLNVVPHDAKVDEASGNYVDEIETLYGRFEVKDGKLSKVQSEADTDKPDQSNDLSLLERYGNRLVNSAQQLAVQALDWVIPQAGAANLFASDSDPMVSFNDTDSGSIFSPPEWRVDADEFAFEIWNQAASKENLYIADTATMQLELNSNSFEVEDQSQNTIVDIHRDSPLALEIQSDGDIELGGNNDLFVDTSTNRVGINTTVPSTPLDVVGPNGLRLQYLNSDWGLFGLGTNGDFGLYNWDTSNYPFAVEEGNNNLAQQIKDNGDIEFGGAAPDDRAKVYIEANKPTGYLPALWMENKTGNSAAFSFVTTSGRIDLGNHNNVFRINYFSPNDGDELQLYNSGNMVIAGALTQNSDVNNKHDIHAVDHQQVLDKVLQMPVTEWTYIRDEKQARHIGPMAQDFHASFGLGATNKGLSSIDTAGVALSAIKGLNAKLAAQDEKLTQQLEAKDTKIAELSAELKQSNAELSAELEQSKSKVAALEAQLGSLETQTARLSSLEAVVANLLEDNNGAVQKAALKIY